MIKKKLIFIKEIVVFFGFEMKVMGILIIRNKNMLNIY